MNIIVPMPTITRFIDWLATPYSLYLVIKEAGVPWTAKLRAVSILLLISLYILNPVDIIPDFHPLLGWLDDIAIIPLAMLLAGKLVPEISIVEAKARARTSVKRILFWVFFWVAVLGIFWLALLGAAIFLAYRFMAGS